jgi:hypothetical protein
MINPKPKKLYSYMSSNNNEKSLYRVPTTSLHHELRNGLAHHGEFYFTVNQFMDAIGLAFVDTDKKKAVEYVLTFNRWLNTLQMQWFDMGYTLLPDNRLAFTYSVQSTRHKNLPLVVHEIIVPRNDPDDFAVIELSGDVSKLPTDLDIRCYEAVNGTALTWISAYKRRPVAEIVKISNGM